MQRGHRMGLSETERPQRRGFQLLSRVVHLVRDENDRLLGPPQHPHRRLVLVQRAHGGVDDEQDDVGGDRGYLRLRGDSGSPVPGVGHPTTGVHHGEAPPRPLGVVGHPVPGHPRHVLDDGLPPTQEAIDQRGLTDVGSTHHRHQRRGSPIGLVSLRGFDVLLEVLLGEFREVLIQVGHSAASAGKSTSAVVPAASAGRSTSAVILGLSPGTGRPHG